MCVAAGTIVVHEQGERVHPPTSVPTGHHQSSPAGEQMVHLYRPGQKILNTDPNMHML